jgi:hypothetical protein
MSTPYDRFFERLHAAERRCGAVGSTIEQGVPSHKGKREVSFILSLYSS